ncbi:hypothetical protein LCGC14_1751590 [marine sediment metagenome]|uniref:Uncharacterized protein n=1 Tax=marine sediment metagenome TaxID=412755 RepID=A0A0F9HR14_9ZZZZ
MFRQIELITLNVASFGWIMASMMDYLPVLIGTIVGLSIAGLNVVRIITEIRKWKAKKKASG